MDTEDQVDIEQLNIEQETCLYCSDNREVIDPGKRIELLCGHWSHTSCFLRRFMDDRLYSIDCFLCRRGICQDLPENLHQVRAQTEVTVRDSVETNDQLQIELCALARLYTDYRKKESAYQKKLRPILTEWKTIVTPHVQALRAYKLEYRRRVVALPEKRQAMAAHGAVVRMMSRMERTYHVTNELYRIIATLKIRKRSMRFLINANSWRFRRRGGSYALFRAFRLRI